MFNFKSTPFQNLFLHYISLVASSDAKLSVTRHSSSISSTYCVIQILSVFDALMVSDHSAKKLLSMSLNFRIRLSVGCGNTPRRQSGESPGCDFAFPDTNFVKALLAMLSALRLVAGSKHAPRAFGSATWQAGASSDRGIHKTDQFARKVN